jgi:hypothetical protein
MALVRTGVPSDSAGVSARRPAPRLGFERRALALRGRVDQLAFRCLGELESAWRGGRARGVVPPHRDVALLDTMAGLASDPEALARALSYALREGAFESMVQLLERLFPQIEMLPEAARERALEDILEALIILGDRPRAAALALQAPRIARTARGATLLDLLDLSSGDVWLPGGRPNLVALSRRISSGALDAVGLRSVIARRPWVWLLYPELHLLAFAAALRVDQQGGLVSMNRFLASHGLPRLRLRDSAPASDNVLARLVTLDKPPLERVGPLVSVIVAARNAEATVSYAVESLLGQSYSALEILVCDDASDDATLVRLRELGRTDARLRVFRSVTHQGAYNVRNALAQHARGELLTFHDADDLAFSTRIGQQVGQLRRGQASACVASLVRVAPNGCIVFHRDQRAARLSLVTLMLSRKLFMELGGFRAVRFGADWELYVKLREALGAASFRRLRTPLMLALCSPSSATRGTGSEALEDGYRSPARRVYSEIALAAQGLAPAISVADEDAWLRASGNYSQPVGVVELEPD